MVQVVLSHLQGSSRAPIRVVQMACGRAHSLLLVHHGGASMVCSTGAPWREGGGGGGGV